MSIASALEQLEKRKACIDRAILALTDLPETPAARAKTAATHTRRSWTPQQRAAQGKKIRAYWRTRQKQARAQL